MNQNTEQALNLIGRALASIQGNLEMHNNLQQALQVVIQDLKSVAGAKEVKTEIDK